MNPHHRRLTIHSHHSPIDLVFRAIVIGSSLLFAAGVRPGAITVVTADTSATPTGLTVGFAAQGPCSVGSSGLANGISGAQVTLSGAGTCSITASQPGDDTYNAATSVVQSFSVAKAPTTVNLDAPTDTAYNDPVTLKATVSPTTLNGQTLTGTVSFSIDGTAVGSAPITTLGVATSAPVTVTQAAGPHAVKAEFVSGNANFAGASTTGTLTVLHEDTSLIYLGDTTGDYHDTVTLKARLLEDGISSSPIASKSVSFQLGNQNCAGITGNDGIASCTLTINQHPGTTLSAQASVAADTTYAATSESKPFIITPEQTTISYTGPTQTAEGSSPVLSATLKEDGTTPIAGKALTLTLGTGTSSQHCITGPTNTAGSAHCTLAAVSQSQGTVPVSASFAGDTDLLSASDTSQKSIVFATYPGGAFMIGDVSAHAGQRSGAPVTFWGGTWSNKNVLSGSATPRPFLGFSRHLSSTPPVCGGSWTSTLPESLGPPKSIPSYMLVAVTNKITQNHNQLTGTISQLAVVQTGQGPLGTGKVISLFCPVAKIAAVHLARASSASGDRTTIASSMAIVWNGGHGGRASSTNLIRTGQSHEVHRSFQVAQRPAWRGWAPGKNPPVTHVGRGVAGTAPNSHIGAAIKKADKRAQQIVFDTLPDKTFGDSAFDISATSMTSTPPSNLPPDPSTIAPKLDSSVATGITASTAFLYTGDHPIQTGVAPGTIVQTRTAVLRGKVLTIDGNPLGGATVKVLNHPEFGQTLSRDDGAYDLVTNGGGPLTLTFAKGGFIGAQRQVQTPWDDYVQVDDVALVRPDANVTPIALSSSSTGMQMAQGGTQSDSDGSRQETVLFPGGTTATEVLPDGSTRTLNTGHMRATEFTVGANGPTAMPANLPPTSAYTYAVDLSFDEAQADGATSVRFNKPVISYNQNFLGMAAGTPVPVGHYDTISGQWVADDNGLVVTILSISDGKANLDVDGTGKAAATDQYASLGISDAERQQLATQYARGTSLWRVAVTHFSWFDFNYGVRAQKIQADRRKAYIKKYGPQDLEALEFVTWNGNGSIQAQDQTFGEDRAVSGTPYLLHYNSDRTPGYTAARTYPIQLSSAVVPSGLSRIELRVQVAGRTFDQTFGPQANQSYNFTWDGKDAYGRTLQGQQRITVQIVDVYPMAYGLPSDAVRAFARYSDNLLTIGHGRGEIAVRQVYTDRIGSWDARPDGLGGWTLDVHHTYDPAGHTLYLGNGMEESARSVNNIITVVAGAPNSRIDNGGAGDGGPALNAQFGTINGIAIGPDGSLYLADGFFGRVRKVDPAGVITTLAGAGSGCPQQTDSVGDGCPATAASLNNPYGLAIGPDGSVYVAEYYGHRVRRIQPNGIITTVAGTGSQGYNGDGILATQAEINSPAAVAVAPDGTIYIAEYYGARVRRVGADGIITTVAGNGTPGYNFNGDNIPASQALLSRPEGLALGPDGSLYILDAFDNHRIRRIDPGGIITTVAGNGDYQGLPPEGGQATSAGIGNPGPHFITAGPDGTIYFGAFQYTYGCPIRSITPDGVEHEIAGVSCSYPYPPTGDNGPAGGAVMDYSTGLALAPDGSLYLAESGFGGSIRKVGLPLPGVGASDILIPSTDAREIYHFDASGRHINTLDALTGAVRYAFGYDTAGRLATVTDGNGDTTTIEHDAAGMPTDIKAPFGQITTLTTNGAGQPDSSYGFLTSIADPLHETATLGYASGGLLTSIAGPNGNTFHFTYDSAGRFTKTQDPATGAVQLNGADLERGRLVTAATALGRNTAYRHESLATGADQLRITKPDTTQYTRTAGLDSTVTSVLSNGFNSVNSFQPDPRFFMEAPVLSSHTVSTPGGLQLSITGSRSASLATPGDPLTLTGQTESLSVNGKTSTESYTVSNHTLVWTSPLGRQVTTVVDGQRRPTHIQAGNLAPATYSYDSHGRLASITSGTGTDARHTSYGYGSDGHLAGATDALGRTTTYTYDAAGHMLTQAVPGEGVMQYAHDANGNLTGITTPGGHTTTFTKDGLDRTSAITRPDVGNGPVQTQLSYNPDRQLQSIALPGGQTVGMTYDATTGKLSSLSGPSGTTSYGYDATTGNLTSISASNGETMSYSYDGWLLTGVSSTGPVSGSVTRSYDNFFRPVSQSVNGGNTANYSYDNDGLLTGAGSLSLARDATTGLISGTTLGSITTSPTYDSFGELTGKSVAAGNTTLDTTTYTRDAGGRVTSKTESINGSSHVFDYSYDSQTGRLTQVKKDGSVVETYTYDADGNRLTGPGVTTNAVYDAQGELKTYGDATYTYTPNGELATRTDGSGLTTYGIDPKDGLTSVTLPGGKSIGYLVNGAGQRVGKQVNGALVQGFLYDQEGRIVAELDGSGNVVSTFVYAGGVTPSTMTKGGTTYRIISDPVGSPRLVIDPTGAIVQQLEYDSFGNVVSDSNPGFQPFGFGGGLYDRDTGLTHLGLRDYDPHTGRWTARDPLGFGAGDTSLYSYAYGDPINFADPSGEGPYIDPNLNIHSERTPSPAEWYNTMAAEHPVITAGTMIVGSVGIAIAGAAALAPAVVAAGVTGTTTVLSGGAIGAETTAVEVVQATEAAAPQVVQAAQAAAPEIAQAAEAAAPEIANAAPQIAPAVQAAAPQIAQAADKYVALKQSLQQSLQEIARAPVAGP